MFIKSQNGRIIFPVTQPIMVGKKPTEDTNWWDYGTKKCKYEYTIESDDYILGSYKTEEQRDEVWADILNWLEYKYTPIFEMPKSRDTEPKKDKR